MKTDLRILRTKRRLHTALLSLMCTKSLDEITVKDLSAAAQINRTTFYLHYKDVYGVFDEFLSVSADTILGFSKRLGFNEIRDNPKRFLDELIKLTISSQEYSSFVEHSQQSKEFLTRLKRRLIDKAELEITEAFESAAAEGRVPTTGDSGMIIKGDIYENIYTMVMIVSGTFDAFSFWLKRGEDISIDRLAQIISRQFK